MSENTSTKTYTLDELVGKMPDWRHIAEGCGGSIGETVRACCGVMFKLRGGTIGSQKDFRPEHCPDCKQSLRDRGWGCGS